MIRSNKLIENILSLATIKGLEYLLAFIIFPYLVRVLGVEHYGMLVFSQSIINYFVLFSDYGFNLLGPREIAICNSKERMARAFAGIFYAKLCLLLLCIIVFGVGMLTISYYWNINWQLYTVFFLLVIGNVFFPIWFFQGIQQMCYITFVNIVARFLSVAGIFIFVKQPNDYVIAAFFQAIVPLIAAIGSWIIIYMKYPELLVLPSIKGIKNMIETGWPIFTSTIAINLYTASNIVFLGLMTNNTIVGYFSGAKKIIDNITQLISPVTQAIYPYISQKVSESRETAIIFLRKIVIVLGGGNLALSVFILIFAEWIIKILLGTGYEASVVLLRVLAFLPFVVSLSNIFGIQTMLAFGLQKEFSRILLLAAILNTCIVLPLIYLFQGLGVCVSITLTESFVTFAMWYILKKNGIVLIGR